MFHQTDPDFLKIRHPPRIKLQKMTRITRHKSLSKKFYRVSIDEHGLHRLAKTIEACDASAEVPTTVNFVTADKRDQYRTTNVNTLLGNELPTRISSFSIRREDLGQEFSVEISYKRMISWIDDPECLTVKVSGTNVNTVTGLFEDLCGQLKDQELWGTTMHKAFSGYLFYFASMGIVAVGAFNLFDWLLDMIAQQVSGFRGSDLQSVLAVLSLGAIVFGSPVVAALAIRELKIQIPGVVLAARGKSPSSIGPINCKIRRQGNAWNSAWQSVSDQRDGKRNCLWQRVRFAA